MGILEKKVQERARRTRIQEQITLTLFRLAVHSSIAFAPERFLRKKLGLSESEPHSVSRRMRQALARLERRGLIKKHVDHEGRWSAQLTSAGEAFADALYAADAVRIRAPKRWDGKWRVVIFDVREKYKGARERLRRLLRKSGFYRLQDSVWVHSYECEELVAFIRKELRLAGSVVYLIAEGVENDALLRAYFRL